MQIPKPSPAVTDTAARACRHQFLPDAIQYEPGALSGAEQAALRAMGHRLEQQARPFGNMQAIYWDRTAGRVEAASDPRGSGSARLR